MASVLREALFVSFSLSIRESAEPVYRAILGHPFVQGIARGDLHRDAMIYYVQQDSQYLATYARIFALAAGQARTLDRMKILAQRMNVLFEGELVPHQNLCQRARISYQDLIRSLPEPAPTTHHYVQHLLASASSGSLAQTIAGALPCYWVYVDLGRDLLRQIDSDASHPFWDWIAFYANDSMQDGLNQLCTLLDEEADRAQDRDQIASAFLHSFRLEYRFFDMAWRQERWNLPGLGGDLT